MGLSFLLVPLLFFASAWTFDDPWFLQSVSSARKLNGDELLRIGEIHDVQNHFPEALTYYEQALESFRSTKQWRGEATALTKIGSIFERQGRREAAAVHLRDALSLFTKVPNSPAHADALLALGRISAWLGSHGEASHLFEQAIDRYSRSHNVQGLDSARIQLGLMRISDGLTEEGLRLLQQAFEDAKTRHDTAETFAALLALGDARWILDDLETARLHYEQALVLVEQSPQISREAGLRYRLAAIYGVTGQQDKGIVFSKRAVTLYQSLRDSSGEAASWSLLASLHQTLRQDQQAEESERRALSLYRQRQLVVHPVRSSVDPPLSRSSR